MPQSIPSSVTVQPYAPEHAPTFLRLLNLVRGQDTGLNSFLNQDVNWPALQTMQRGVAVQTHAVADPSVPDLSVVGMAELSHFDYVPAGWLRLTLAVDPEARSQGTGARLYGWVQAQADELRPGGLSVGVLDQDTHSREWAERRGFVLHAHRFASQLDLSQPYPAPELPEGTSLRDMSGAAPAEWERLETLYGDLLTQTPDLAGLPRWTPEQLRAHLRDNPRARPEWTLLAVSEAGEILGLCQGVSISTGIYNEFTGVIAAARGLGLARALKLELIRRARAAGVLLMRTNNHAANLPMLSVNRRLGFVQLSGSWELHRRL